MKTKINFLALFAFCSTLSFGQNSQPNMANDQNSIIYVCFSKGINSEKTAFSRNADLERFSRENHISFKYDLDFTDSKLDEMARSSKAIGNSGESVEKLKRIIRLIFLFRIKKPQTKSSILLKDFLRSNTSL